jgi:hypothetical protein
MLVNLGFHEDKPYGPCVINLQRNAENVETGVDVSTYPSIDLFGATRGWTS